MAQTTYTHADIMAAERIARLNLINSLSGFKSANLVGTKDSSGGENVAVFSSVIHLGSNPPLLGMIVRPTSVPRNTYSSIIETGMYTINHINSSFIAKAHQTSAKYDPDVSEFDAVGLTPEYLDDFPAPFVAESVIKIALRLEEDIFIKSNDTHLIVGSIRHVYFPEDAQREDGSLDLSKAGTVAISGLDTYLETKELDRFGYARP